MKQLTKEMIRHYRIKELNEDFMGYSLEKGDIYTFHHLIVPARFGGKIEWQNGAILCGKSSHPYLHLIESKDYELFMAITYEMLKENEQGFISPQNLHFIDDCLLYFEREYSGKRSKNGKLLIKEEYTRRYRHFN